MRLFIAAVLACVVLLSGCAASGAKYSEMATSIPTLQKSEGRVYFLRTNSILGAAMQPEITLNGTVVGKSRPGGFFFIDAKPGKQEVSTATESDQKLNFTLKAGEIRYVKTSVGMGMLVGRVYPQLVEAADAQKELPQLSFTGTIGK